ncbi:MAG: hypothetical protein ACREJO_16510, partial [Phycisphaerales bacterium]
MAQTVVVHGFSEMQRQEVVGHWNRRLQGIKKLLSSFSAEQNSLRLAVRAHVDACEAHVVLMVPTGTLAAKGRSSLSDPIMAIDEAADRLTSEIHRHKVMLRREFLHQRRRRRRRADLSGILSMLEDRHAAGDHETFVTLLHPALRELSEHARRELILAQLEGIVLPGNLTVSSLLSELVARAWSRFAERPAGLRLEVWLTGVLHEVLDERGREPLHPSREVVMKNDRRATAESGWTGDSEGVWPLADKVTLAAVVAIPASGSAWERASDEDQRIWILSQLRGFSRLQRRAFTLYVLEGWNDDEIAAIQIRAPEDVLLDV